MVEFCSQCRAMRSMRTVTSRIQILRRGRSAVEIRTRTCYCMTCSTLLLKREPQIESLIQKRVGASGAEQSRQIRRGSALRILKKSIHGAIAVLALFLLASCETVPVTKRHQLDLVPASTVLPMSFNSYKDFLSKHKVIENTPEAQMVTRVGTRIANAVQRYMAENKMADRLKGYSWEFHLVDDPQVNAWCMPGGKVVVYSGILPVTKDENGLAVVLGHEISHAVANHGDERMSQGLLAQMGEVALDVALAQKPAATQQLFQAAYGAGAEVGVLLPYSRLQESEADHLGLIFMAMAGYDPRGAVPFWQRMIQSQHGSTPPAFLSDHPADQKRIQDIEKLMPEALKYYKP